MFGVGGVEAAGTAVVVAREIDVGDCVELSAFENYEGTTGERVMTHWD